MLPLLKRTPTITLDVDWVWRRLLPALARAGAAVLRAGRQAGGRGTAALLRGTQAAVERSHGLDSRLARTWPTGAMALSVLLLLAGYLLLYYL